MNITRRLALFLLAALPLCAAETALDRYVNTPDPNYKFEIVKTIPAKGVTTYIVELTSQAWLTEKEVNRTVWKHWLTIVKPDKVDHSTGFLFISGGSNKSKAPASADLLVTLMATQTNSVAAELKMVPNQPLSFHGETRERTEDSLIAYGWDRFLKGEGEQWLARLPMTKSAVRAMDTVTAVLEQQAKTKVDKFVVSGGSKRGWTTWTTAAVDKRVVAIAPAVIDMLNMVPSFQHHWQVYGGWSPAINDYLENDIMKWTGTKRYDELLKVVEPYSYRDRLTLPKYIVNAAGDEFFLPDSSQFYWSGLKGEKYLRYVPNAKHSLAGSDASQTMSAFYSLILNNKPRPKFDWKFNKDGSITVKTIDKPKAVKIWQATNPNARDFRLDVIGKAYTETPLTETKPNVYVAKVPAPQKGWTAFFVELTYDVSTTKFPFKATSGVRVVPDIYPFQSPQLGSSSGPGPTSKPAPVRNPKLPANLPGEPANDTALRMRKAAK